MFTLFCIDTCMYAIFPFDIFNFLYPLSKTSLEMYEDITIDPFISYSCYEYSCFLKDEFDIMHLQIFENVFHNTILNFLR